MDKYKNKNLTRIFFRFLKTHKAFSGFQYAIKTTEEGVALRDTFYALKFDNKGKKERYANDPIKWLMVHEDSYSRGERFLLDLLNVHISWASTKEGPRFWEHLHKCWQHFCFYDMQVSSHTLEETIRLVDEEVKTQNTFLQILKKERRRKIIINTLGIIAICSVICLILSLISKYI